MKSCNTCKFCKRRVGFLKPTDFCTRFRRPALQTCADHQPNGLGKRGGGAMTAKQPACAIVEGA